MKVAALVVAEGLVLAAASGLDGLAERVVLYAAAGAGLLWFYVTVLRPLVKLVRRTVDAVESFEAVPGWRRDIDERMSGLEAEVAQLSNGQRALLREWGIADRVRGRDEPV